MQKRKSISEASNSPSEYRGSVVLFRDFDRIWHRADKTGFNKSGYVTRRGTVIHPWLNRGMAETPLSCIRRRPHAIVRMIAVSPPDAENIESFFTKNVPCFDLFNSGMVALTTGNDLAFFSNTVRIPILDKITPEEFERRWAKFRSTLEPADIIATIDTKSRISRLIANFDHGTWSHVGLYMGHGVILEAIRQGVIERHLEAYHDRKYRLGIYRWKAGISKETAGAIVRSARSMLGLPYGFYNLFRLSLVKLLALKPSPDPIRNLSPNDIARSERARLIHVV